MATPIPLAPEVPEPCQVVKDVQLRPRSPDPIPSVEEPEDTEAQLLVKPEPSKKPTEIAESLEDLSSVDRLSVTRKLKVRSVLALRYGPLALLALKSKKNRFFVRTPDQNLVFTIEEENRWWVGYVCYAGLRPLLLRVINRLGNEVIRIRRPYAFTTRVLPCQLQRLQVYAPPGRLIGSVVQQWTAVKPLYIIRDTDGSDVFVVHGPRFTLSCFKDVQFQIVRPDGTLVAATNKRWKGVMHALFFSPITDTFGMVFLDKTMSGEEKALLLAAALLLDYMYYDI